MGLTPVWPRSRRGPTRPIMQIAAPREAAHPGFGQSNWIDALLFVSES